MTESELKHFIGALVALADETFSYEGDRIVASATVGGRTRSYDIKVFLDELAGEIRKRESSRDRAVDRLNDYALSLGKKRSNYTPEEEKRFKHLQGLANDTFLPLRILKGYEEILQLKVKNLREARSAPRAPLMAEGNFPARNTAKDTRKEITLIEAVEKINKELAKPRNKSSRAEICRGILQRYRIGGKDSYTPEQLSNYYGTSKHRTR